jgi:hypothetical protein
LGGAAPETQQFFLAGGFDTLRPFLPYPPTMNEQIQTPDRLRPRGIRTSLPQPEVRLIGPA